MAQQHTIWILRADGAPLDEPLQFLREQGCEVHLFETIDPLIQACANPPASAGEATLLFSDIASNCQAAWGLRHRPPTHPLVARLGGPTDSEHAALLRLGVNGLLHPKDRPERLWTTLRAHWDHNAPSSRLEGPVLRIGAWSLIDHGWNLQHHRQTVRYLGVSERALLMCLFQTPGHVASIATLEAAVRGDWQAIRGRRPRDPNLRGVISQLRRRLKESQLPLPIEALRNFGYIWVP